MAQALTYKKEFLDSNNAVFMFDKIYDYKDYIKTRVDELPQLNENANRVYKQIFNESSLKSMASDPNWYGTTNIEEVKGTLDKYLFADDLNNFLDQFKDQTVSADKLDIDQKKKIVFTSQEIGIFSFDLASLGLIRVYEYYSPTLDKIVSPNFIKSYRDDNGRLIFYHIEVVGVPRHRVEVGEDGSLFSKRLMRKLDQEEVDKEDDGDEISYFYRGKPHIEKHEVERRQKVDKKGNKVFSSTFKKSFIYIPKVETTLPRIDLIINASYRAGVNAKTQMIWSSMAAIAVAEKLAKSNVDFRIFASYPVENSGKTIYTFVKIKDVNEPLNINGLAVLTSDARQYRYEQFKAIIALNAEAGWGSLVNTSLGSPINDVPKIKNAFIKFLKSQQDFDSNDGDVYENSKIVFGQSLSRDSATELYDKTIKEIAKAKLS